MSAQEPQPYRYYVKGERPRHDAEFFELLLVRHIHATGGIGDFDEVWPRAVHALSGLHLRRLSNLPEPEIKQAVSSVGGGFSSRFSDKSGLLKSWAEAFWRVRQVYGSFRRYLDSFEADGFDVLLDDLKGRLSGLSPEFLIAYLREAGEKIPALAGGSRSGSQRSRRSRGDRESGNGGRRRGQRGGGNKKQVPKPPAAKSTPAPAEEAKTGNRARRGRRRFFRRKRSQSTNSTPSE